MFPGAITDVAGLRVGHFTDPRRPTGCTVLLCEQGVVAGVDVRGAAPGTRETDLLHPLDIEDFPTLLLASGNVPRFLGPVTPQAEMLERLIRSQLQDPAAPALADKSISDLVLRIRAKTSA